MSQPVSPSDAAIAVVREFVDAFNAQDHHRLAHVLNYPHIRLANDRFARIESAADFEAGSRSHESTLRQTGWDHTVIKHLSVVHSSPTKVHLAITNDRVRSDGSLVVSFDTFWIATLQDGHWGIQFRSSYLR